MRSTSDSETAALRGFLAASIERPTMYGDPDEVEAGAKHALHVLMVARTTGWTYQGTTGLWSELACSLTGTSSFCARDSAALAVRHWWRWGADEAGAYRAVVDGIRSALTASGFDSHDASASKAWADHLMANPRLVGNPGQFERVLAVLYSIAAEAVGIDFDATYKASLVRAERGDARRSFADLGSLREWLAREPAEILSFVSYAQVAAGIKAACERCAISVSC